MSDPTPVCAKGGNQPPGAQARCRQKVTVKIVSEYDVACPGHLFEMTAVGSPDGGKYQWAVSGGGAKLVDSSGKPATTDADARLFSFEPDNNSGKIPAQTASVTVTYTHPNGKATASKTVPIHQIDFVVTDTNFKKGVTTVKELQQGVNVRHDADKRIATIEMTPTVEIQLAPNCPRQDACALNHEIGWLQDLTRVDRRIRWTHTLATIVIKTPIRDEVDRNTSAPFYYNSSLFTGNKDKQKVLFRDSPNIGAPWSDQYRPASPAPPPAINKQLRWVKFYNEFHTWLAVRNNDADNLTTNKGFIYLRNFNWSCGLNFDVDTSKPIGTRCQPRSKPVTLGALANGKGSLTPAFSSDTAGGSQKVNIAAAPALVQIQGSPFLNQQVVNIIDSAALSGKK